MLEPPGKPKRAFFLQGLLIVLPVAVMAAVGLFAIRRDRVVIYEEARRNAAQLVEQLAATLAKRIPAQLAMHDQLSDAWHDHHWELATANRANAAIDSYLMTLKEWQTANPGLSADLVQPNRILFRGESSADYVELPVVPTWIFALGDQQLAAWKALSAAGNAGSNHTVMLALTERFLDSNPGFEARANAQFLLVRAGLREETALDGLRSLETLSPQCRGCRGESGLPLMNLVAAEALNALSQNAHPKQILGVDVNDSGGFPPEILSWILEEPSLLSLGLIETFERLVSENGKIDPEYKASVLSALTIATAQQRLHDLAGIISHRRLSSGPSLTNFWLSTDSGSWFCRPSRAAVPAALPRAPTIESNREDGVVALRMYPKELLDAAAAAAIREAGLFIPQYVGLQIQFEGEPLPLGSKRTATWEARSAPVPPPDITRHLVRQAGYELIGNMPKREGSTLTHPILATGQGQFTDPPVSWSLGQAGSNREKLLAQARDISVPTEFAVSVYLANPGLLYRQQRQRTWIFGGLILASMSAAVIGFTAAYRSFRRQLRLNELKSNFVSSVSHELRAPIASVRLMAESLQERKITEPQKQHEYFRFIVQECRRLSSLIENVLDFSRIEDGRKQFDLEPTDPIELTTHTVQLMQAYAAERQISLTSDISHSLIDLRPELVADGKALQQALVNLIDNALKHTPNGGKVIVGMKIRNPSDAEQWLDLWVEDYGPGIPREEHEKIFERFYRLGSEMRRETPGVGIGLSIVKHVVEAHGGWVRVDSTVGKGSRFTIELPFDGGNTSK